MTLPRLQKQLLHTEHLPRSAAATSCLTYSPLCPAPEQPHQLSLPPWELQDVGSPRTWPSWSVNLCLQHSHITAQLTVTSLHKPSNPVRPDASKTSQGRHCITHSHTHPPPRVDSFRMSGKRACHSPALDNIPRNTTVQSRATSSPQAATRPDGEEKGTSQGQAATSHPLTTTEGLRLKGTTVGYLVQSPCSSRVIQEHMAQDCVRIILEYL